MLLYVGLLITALILYFYRVFSYWSRKGLASDLPIISIVGVIFRKMSLADLYNDLYYKFRKMGAKHFGLYILTTPLYLAIDPNIIRSILIKDFWKFCDRPITIYEDKQPLSAHLAALKGEKWKMMRSTLSSAFTDAKMKMLLPLILDRGEAMAKLVGETLRDKSPVDIRDVAQRYTTDVIISCIFGIESRALENHDDPFYDLGKRSVATGFFDGFCLLMVFLFPWVVKIFNLPIVSASIEKLIMTAVEDTVTYREANGVKRKDLMQILIELKNNSDSTKEENLNGKPSEKQFENTVNITTEVIAAQCLVFFVAGFETSASTIQYCLYELARNQEIQDKTRKEILAIQDKNNNQLTYATLAELTYLDQVISETLRMHPTVPFLIRVAQCDYLVEGTDIKIEKNQVVVIPIWALHTDEEYFSNPHTFDPERFSRDRKSQIKPFTYLPFGGGPRNCIGLKLANIELKVGIAMLLRRYKFSLSHLSPQKIRMDPWSFVLAPKEKIYLNVTSLEQEDL